MSFLAKMFWRRGFALIVVLAVFILLLIILAIFLSTVRIQAPAQEYTNKAMLASQSAFEYALAILYDIAQKRHFEGPNYILEEELPNYVVIKEKDSIYEPYPGQVLIWENDPILGMDFTAEIGIRDLQGMVWINGPRDPVTKKLKKSQTLLLNNLGMTLSLNTDSQKLGDTISNNLPQAGFFDIRELKNIFPQEIYERLENFVTTVAWQEKVLNPNAIDYVKDKSLIYKNCEW
jgi:hypothetical protein